MGRTLNSNSFHRCLALQYLKMVSFTSIVSRGLLGVAAATALAPTPDELPGCGEVNVFMTGLPAYHPTVIALGLDPAMVDRMLREDAARIVSMGYNLRVAVVGPEEDYNKILRDQMCGTEWHGTGVGYGLRNGKSEPLTIQFEDVITLLHEQAPGTPVMFNYNAASFHWAVQRRLPLAGNCTDSPGTDLGFIEFCEICEKPE